MHTNRLFGRLAAAACLALAASACAGNKSATVGDPSTLPPAGQFLEAAATGDVAKLKTLLASDSELVNTRGAQGITPLHNAAKFGQNASAQFLLDHDADPNAVDDNNSTAANMALGESHKDTAKIITSWIAKHGGAAPQ